MPLLPEPPGVTNRIRFVVDFGAIAGVTRFREILRDDSTEALRAFRDDRSESMAIGSRTVEGHGRRARRFAHRMESRAFEEGDEACDALAGLSSGNDRRG